MKTEVHLPLIVSYQTIKIHFLNKCSILHFCFTEKFSGYKLLLKTTKQSSYPLGTISFQYLGTHTVFCSIFLLQYRRVYSKRHHIMILVALPTISLLILCPLSRSLQHPQNNSKSIYSLKDSTNLLNVIIQEWCWQDTPLHTTITKPIYHSVALVPASNKFLSNSCFAAFFTQLQYLKFINPSGQKLHSFNSGFCSTYQTGH